MRSENVLNHVRRTPFQPFRLTLTDGRTYVVRHPELAMVGRSSVIIGLPSEQVSEPIFDRFVDISLLHIMQIDPVPAASAS